MPGDGPAPTDERDRRTRFPHNLREFVQADQISYQFATVSDPERVLRSRADRRQPHRVGSSSTLELYLVFPLASEDRSLSLVRGTMLIGGAVLMVLLAAISMLVARQVVLPIRSASRIAVRFADGRLKERMPVRGEDDMARLGDVVQRDGRESVEADHPARGVRQSAEAVHLRRQPRAAHSADHGPDGSRPDPRRQRGSRPVAASGRRNCWWPSWTGSRGCSATCSRSPGTTPVSRNSRPSNSICGCVREPPCRRCATSPARPAPN